MDFDFKAYLMDELWPLLTDEERQKLVDLASLLAMYAPKPDDSADADQRDTDA